MVMPGAREMANLTRWSGLVGEKIEAGPGVFRGGGSTPPGFVTPRGLRSAGPVVTDLAEAVSRNVRPGDTLHVMLGHSRWTASARELARQFWGEDPGFTLVMTSLGALGALFFRGGLVQKVVTAYSGNTFPTYGPNPVFRKAYESGEVEVEQWSILTLSQRLEAAARGLPAAVTGSLVGSSMADNDAFHAHRFTRSGRSACCNLSRRTWHWSMPRWPTRRATLPSPNRCSTEYGVAGQPSGE